MGQSQKPAAQHPVRAPVVERGGQPQGEPFDPARAEGCALISFLGSAWQNPFLGSELGSRDCALTFSSPGTVGHDEEMTVIKINAITVPANSGDELAHRFAARAGAVDNADGFEGFELLKPTDGRKQWLVVTAGAMRSRSRLGSTRTPSPLATAQRPSVAAKARRHRSSPIARSGPTYALVDPVPADRRSARQ